MLRCLRNLARSISVNSTASGGGWFDVGAEEAHLSICDGVAAAGIAPGVPIRI